MITAHAQHVKAGSINPTLQYDKEYYQFVKNLWLGVDVRIKLQGDVIGAAQSQNFWEAGSNYFGF